MLYILQTLRLFLIWLAAQTANDMEPNKMEIQHSTVESSLRGFAIYL